jgi:hypothetical protein
MSIEAESLLVVLAAISIVVLIFILSPKDPEPPKAKSSYRTAGESIPLPFAIAAQVGLSMSAVEMLSRIQALHKSNAQWNAIFSELNPTHDSEVQQLLTEIRGPNMFAPHVGLSVIEDGCKRALAVSPNSNAVDSLRQAIGSQDSFVR